MNSYWQTRLMVNYFTHVLLILRSGFILHTLSKPVGFITPPPTFDAGFALFVLAVGWKLLESDDLSSSY